MDVCPIRYSVVTVDHIDQYNSGWVRKAILRYVLDGSHLYGSERGRCVQCSGCGLASYRHGRRGTSRAGANKYELVEWPAPDCGHDNRGGYLRRRSRRPLRDGKKE